MFELKNESCILEASFSQGIFSYSMSDCESNILQAVKKEYYIKVSMKNISSLIDKLYEIIENDYNQSSFKNICKLLYQQLIPKELSEILCKKQRYINIVTKNQEIPWELLHDGDNFLGIKHLLGRIIVGCEGSRPSNPRNRTAPSCLLISNPSGDLPKAEEESRVLMAFLRDNGIKCNYLSHYQVSVSDILMELNSSKYDFIHYNGHIAKDPETREYSFILADNEYFSLNSVSVLEGFGNPFVFVNGCGGKVNAFHTYGGQYVNEGVVIPFIYAGARAVIGSSWKVSDEGARVFAEKVYQYIFSGDMAGEAMAKARAEVFRENPDDPTWASFILYGNPCLCFVNSVEIPELPGKLARADFDDKVWSILELSSKYAKQQGTVSTTHLFLAMLETMPDDFAEMYGKLEITPDEFIDALRKIVETYESQQTGIKEEKLRFSANVKKILVNSGVLASDNKEKIDVRHLMNVLVETKEAGFYKITNLVYNHIRDKKEKYAQEAALRNLFDDGGYIRDEGFGSDMLATLRAALEYAQDQVITTTHLFIGMTMKSGSWLLKMLNDMGVSKEQIGEWLGFVSITPGGEEKPAGIGKIHISQLPTTALLKLKTCRSKTMQSPALILSSPMPPEVSSLISAQA